MVAPDQVDQHLFLDVYIPGNLAPVAFFQQGFLSLDKGASFRGGSGFSIESVIHPTKVSIRPVGILDAVAIY